ncbi:MAG: hypothetical protein RI885_1986 [Actinomycetota bacterium]
MSPPTSVVELCRAFTLRMPASARFSHTTAALLLGAPLPFRHQSATPLHVSVPWPERALRVTGVTGHKLRLNERATERQGLRITSPEQTWCDLAAILSLPELVAVGDFLIHWRLPYTTLQALRNFATGHPARRGRARLLEAIELLDDRAESPRESMLRVILHHAGITETVSNLDIPLPGVRRVPRVDLAIPRLKIAIEYQGDYHRDQKQWRADMTRISRLRAHGWTVIEVNADDLDDPAELVARIRLVIASREAASSTASASAEFGTMERA